MTSNHPVETVLRSGLRLLVQVGLPLAALALVFPAPSSDDGLLEYTLVHLGILQIATFLFAIQVGPLTDAAWFGGMKRPWLASVASVVAALVGFSALLTLATSAAARYDVSLQFLQLLSSLDIAWVVATLYIGARRIWGATIGVIAGSLLLAACVVSIAVYLVIVGFSPDGGWLVDGGQMMRVVIPADTIAALVSIGVLLLAARRASQPTSQASLQSYS